MKRENAFVRYEGSIFGEHFIFLPDNPYLQNNPSLRRALHLNKKSDSDCAAICYYREFEDPEEREGDGAFVIELIRKRDVVGAYRYAVNMSEYENDDFESNFFSGFGDLDSYEFGEGYEGFSVIADAYKYADWPDDVHSNNNREEMEFLLDWCCR